MQNEVIIDGCNVAECWFYVDVDDLNCSCSMESSNRCRNNHNCYFKQLQRVKAENKELKKLNANHLKIINDFLHENNILKAENGKLKQALKEVREWLLKWRFNANIIKHTNEPLNKINEVLNETQET